MQSMTTTNLLESSACLYQFEVISTTPITGITFGIERNCTLSIGNLDICNLNLYPRRIYRNCHIHLPSSTKIGCDDLVLCLASARLNHRPKSVCAVFQSIDRLPCVRIVRRCGIMHHMETARCSITVLLQIGRFRISTLKVPTLTLGEPVICWPADKLALGAFLSEQKQQTTYLP